MAITKRQREANHHFFAARGRHGGAPPAEEKPRFGMPYETEKLINGAWVRMGHYQGSLNDRRIDAHAAALTGDVRLVRKRDQAVVVQWRDGVRTELEERI